jgi:hypothetical protein
MAEDPQRFIAILLLSHPAYQRMIKPIEKSEPMPTTLFKRADEYHAENDPNPNEAPDASKRWGVRLPNGQLMPLHRIEEEDPLPAAVIEAMENAKRQPNPAMPKKSPSIRELLASFRTAEPRIVYWIDGSRVDPRKLSPEAVEVLNRLTPGRWLRGDLGMSDPILEITDREDAALDVRFVAPIDTARIAYHQSYTIERALRQIGRELKAGK